MTLREYQTTYRCEGFQPGVVHRCPGGDLRVWWEDEGAYAETVSPGLTLMRSMHDGRVVGVSVYPPKTEE